MRRPSAGITGHRGSATRRAFTPRHRGLPGIHPYICPGLAPGAKAGALPHQLGCLLPLLSFQAAPAGALPVHRPGCAAVGLGTDGWSRTSNLRVNNPSLSLLSYVGRPGLYGKAAPGSGSLGAASVSSGFLPGYMSAALPGVLCCRFCIPKTYSHLAPASRGFPRFLSRQRKVLVRRLPGRWWTPVRCRLAEAARRCRGRGRTRLRCRRRWGWCGWGASGRAACR